MSEKSPVTSHQSPVTGPEEEDTKLLDFLIILAKRKKLVLGLPFGTAIVAFVVVFLIPNFYTATAKILPPQQSQSSTSALLAQFGALMGGVGGASGPLAFRNPNDLYVGMLKSRTVADNLISRFDLKKVYDKDTMFDTRKKLADRSTFISGRDGIIAIEVEDTDPKRAAEIANAYVEELYKLTSTLAITEASQRRLFFEKQLKQTRDQLAEAEIALRHAIDAKGLSAIDVQSRAILEPSAQLRAQIALREVQLSAIRIFATDQHPDIERLRHEIASMKRELSKLEGGDGEPKVSATNSSGLGNLRRFRDMKFLERLTELLTQQSEAARIDEAKDISIIQVLDKAVEPEKKTGPKRALIVAIAFLGFGFAVIPLAMVMEWLEHASLRERNKLEVLKSILIRRH